jgi:hypothetical protein
MRTPAILLNAPRHWTHCNEHIQMLNDQLSGQQETTNPLTGRDALYNEAKDKAAQGDLESAVELLTNSSVNTARMPMHSMIWASCTMNWAKKKKHWGATAKP